MNNWEQMRSSRVVRGYRRMCYPETACFACLMLDGEFYPVNSEPCDHPNGKCSFVPVTRHFDPADDPNWQRGPQWFMEQDEETQRKLMGPGRFELWKSGGVDPKSMVYIKPNDIWGGSPAIRTLESMGYGKLGTYLKTDFPSTPEINFQMTEKIQIAGIDIIKSEGVRDMPNGKGGYLRAENCDIYKTEDGMEFVFPKSLDKKLQTLTPNQLIQAWCNISKDIQYKAQQRIIVVDYSNPEDSFWKKVYKTFTNSWATGNVKEITFYSSQKNHNLAQVTRAIIHEIGHRIDLLEGNISAGKDWIEAMADDQTRTGFKSPTTYGENSNREDFAESLAGFEYNRTEFEKVFTNRALIIKMLLSRK